MDSTTNFDEWLDAADPCDAANIAGLVTAVEQECEFSGFKAIRASNGKLIVTARDVDQKLILVSDVAKDAFIRCIHGRFVPDGMDAEIYAAVEHHNDAD